jgi:hypothetical protein
MIFNILLALIAASTTVSRLKYMNILNTQSRDALESILTMKGHLHHA